VLQQQPQHLERVTVDCIMQLMMSNIPQPLMMLDSN
jgi:hypothetical protein